VERHCQLFIGTGLENRSSKEIIYRFEPAAERVDVVGAMLPVRAFKADR
jgi:hypothetical protein